SRMLKSTAQASGPPAPPPGATVGVPYVTFASGRWSNRSAWPSENTAAARPGFEIVTVQVQLAPTAAAPPTLFVLVTARSGPRTATVSAQALLFSNRSGTKLFGSTAQALPGRGFTYWPSTEATAVNAT